MLLNYFGDGFTEDGLQRQNKNDKSAARVLLHVVVFGQESGVQSVRGGTILVVFQLNRTCLL